MRSPVSKVGSIEPERTKYVWYGATFGPTDTSSTPTTIRAATTVATPVSAFLNRPRPRFTRRFGGFGDSSGAHGSVGSACSGATGWTAVAVGAGVGGGSSGAVCQSGGTFS